MSRQRIRTVKPEWLEDERLAACSDTARMVSVALIALSDDYGNGRAHPLYLASRIWPYASGEPRETLMRLSRALTELDGIGFLTLYTVKNQQYFSIKNWSKHQKVQHPGRPAVPGPAHADSVEGPPTAGSNGACSGGPHEDRERVSGESHESLPPYLGSGILDLGSGILDLGSGSGSGPQTRARSPGSGTVHRTARVPGEVSKAAAAAGLTLQKPSLEAADVAAEWHRIGQQFLPELVHSLEVWGAEFEVVASACNAVSGNPAVACRAMLEWFWTAAEGPIASGRIPLRAVTPKPLAKHVSRDLVEAYAWWQKQNVPRETHEAVQ